MQGLTTGQILFFVCYKQLWLKANIKSLNVAPYISDLLPSTINSYGEHPKKSGHHSQYHAPTSFSSASCARSSLDSNIRKIDFTYDFLTYVKLYILRRIRMRRSISLFINRVTDVGFPGLSHDSEADTPLHLCLFDPLGYGYSTSISQATTF